MIEFLEENKQFAVFYSNNYERKIKSKDLSEIQQIQENAQISLFLKNLNFRSVQKGNLIQ